MPATEQTWRSQKLLHKIFAIGSLLLLVSTIWMFSKDHDRQNIWQLRAVSKQPPDVFGHLLLPGYRHKLTNPDTFLYLSVQVYLNLYLLSLIVTGP